MNPTAANPYPTRTTPGAYDRNVQAFGPAAATLIGLADATQAGASDIGASFGELLEDFRQASRAGADAAGEAAQWVADAATTVASDLAVVALLASAGASTAGPGGAA